MRTRKDNSMLHDDVVCLEREIMLLLREYNEMYGERLTFSVKIDIKDRKLIPKAYKLWTAEPIVYTNCVLKS